MPGAGLAVAAVVVAPHFAVTVATVVIVVYFAFYIYYYIYTVLLFLYHNNYKNKNKFFNVLTIDKSIQVPNQTKTFYIQFKSNQTI